MFTQTLFTQITDTTAENTAAETSAVGPGTGTLQLPQKFWMAGRSLRVSMQGRYTVPLLGATLTVRVKHGAVVLASFDTTALISSAGAWTLDAVVTCRSHGATSLLQVNGATRYQALLVTAFDTFSGSGSVDSDPSALFDITAQWDSASASRSLTTDVAVFEFLS